jgi:uncharacterized protein (DUF1501 family)
MNRRFFLKSSTLGVLSLALAGVPPFLGRAALASPQTAKKRTLVAIFQRGAVDGIAAVQPIDDKSLRAMRPDLVLQPGDLLNLDGVFGLHPALSPLAKLFGDKKLAIVHGVGSPNKSRSHFDAQSYMELGTPYSKSGDSGWLNRAAGLLGQGGSLFRTVALADDMPESLKGPNTAVNLHPLEEFYQDHESAQSQAVEALYKSTSHRLLKENGENIREIKRILSSKAFRNYTPKTQYPISLLGNSLRETAQLIKGDLGVEIAFLEIGGWDTHHQQGAQEGAFARRAREFADAVSAFWLDLEEHREHVTLMTMTEFGRAIHQNGSGGTDHGRASCAFVLGEDVKGGAVYGSVPALRLENLEDGRDLPVTTDFRSVFTEVAMKHLRLESSDGLFPGWRGERLELLRPV